MTTLRLVLLILLVPLVGALVVVGLRSADGPDIVYGDAHSLGGGTVRAFVTHDTDGTPLSLGLTFSTGALDGLPAQPPHVGPAHETTLALPSLVRGRPFDHISVDWNPMGHEPEGMYTAPHFDFHFYTMTEAERNTIDPMATDFEAKASRHPDASFLPANHLLAPGTVPRMGNHWVDRAAPELNGRPFSATFIYGAWDGRVAFLEPMITKAFIESVRDVDGQRVVKAVPQPSAVQRPGYYPTTYAIEYDETNDSYAFVLGGLTFRE